MDTVGLGTYQLEHGFCFVIAIDAKPKQNSDTRLHHATPAQPLSAE